MRIFWLNGTLRFAGVTQEETDALFAFRDMLEADSLKVGRASRDANKAEMEDEWAKPQKPIKVSR